MSNSNRSIDNDNGTSNVISLDLARQARAYDNEAHAYRANILAMDKMELLEEMIRFQEERSRVGRLTVDMMIRGKHLFTALEKTAETRELKILTGSYRRHLELELAAHRAGVST